MLDLDDVRWELGRFGKLNVRHGKGSRRKGPKPRLVPLINGADRDLRWFIEDVWGQFDDDHDRPGAPLFPSERKCQDGSCSRATDGRVPPVAGRGRRAAPARLVGQANPACPAAFLRVPALPVRDDPVRHPGATRTFLDRDDGPVRPRARHPRRGRLGGGPAARRRPMERTRPVKWNLRLAAANRGIWKASELQQMLAARGMVISAGKMSGLWSGSPNTIRLDELDVICAVLGCGVDELLLPEPGKVPQPAPEDAGAASRCAAARAVTPAGARRKVAAAPVNCLHCGKPLPAGSRRDRSYCNKQLQRAGLLYRRKNGIAAAAALAAPGAHVGQPAAARGRRAGPAARRGQRLVPVHHPVRDGRPDRAAGRPARWRARHAHRDPGQDTAPCLSPARRRGPRRARPARGRHRPGGPVLDRPAHRGTAAGLRHGGQGLAAGAARRRRPVPAQVRHHHLRLLHRRRAAHRPLVSRAAAISGRSPPRTSGPGWTSFAGTRSTPRSRRSGRCSGSPGSAG